MTREEFALFWGFMEENALESAHDRLHVERVLYGALEIARTEEGVDRDVLVCACVLHDIGRREQAADPKVCHAVAGRKRPSAFCWHMGTIRRLPSGWPDASKPTGSAPGPLPRAWRPGSSTMPISWTPPAWWGRPAPCFTPAKWPSPCIPFGRTAPYPLERKRSPLPFSGSMRISFASSTTGFIPSGDRNCLARREQAEAFRNGLLAELEELYRMGRDRLEALWEK